MIYTLSIAKQLSVRVLAIIIAMTLILSLGFLSPALTRAEGATVTWTGSAGDKSWHTAGNWDGGQVPSSGDTVRIPAASVVEYVYGAVYGETTVTLECAGQLTVSGGSTLNITGPSGLDGGTLINLGTVNINASAPMDMNVLENVGNATVNSDLTLKDLQLKSGTVDGSGNLTIDDSLNPIGWTGGTLGGTGTLTVGPQGRFPITWSNPKNLNRNLVNKGHIYFSGTAPTISSSIAFINSGEIEVSHEINPEVSIPNYTQTETGVLTLDMRDATSNPHWAARLDTENASLAGTLNLEFVSYDPAIDTSFEVLAYDTYSGQFASIASNLAGKTFASSYGSNILTATVQNAVDVPGPPTASAYTPANGAQVSVNTDNLVLMFNETVWGVTGKSVVLCHNTGASIISFNAAYVNGQGTDTITIPLPPGTLSSNTDYCVKIDADAFEDSSGNTYAGIADTTTWTFSTVPFSAEAEITGFNFTGSNGSLIDYAAETITVLVPHGTDITSLIPTFTLSPGASAEVGGVSQVSGTTSNDFTAPVTYVVTAEDESTTKNWTVSVTIMEPLTPSVQPLWDYRSPLPTLHHLNDVKYLNGKFIAIGETGSLITSTDGITWEKVDTGIVDNLSGIAYGNGIYVAVGNNSGTSGKLYTSNNGVNWSQAAETPSHQLYDVAFENNKFIAVGQSGKIVSSSDGATWNIKPSSAINKNLSSITYTGSLYVAVGSKDGNIVTSPDGETWTAQETISYDLWDVAYGDGKLVAVGGDYGQYQSPRLYTSADGITWTQRTLPSAYARLLTVEYDGSQFIAAGNYWTGYSYVLKSTDGITWTKQDVPINARFNAISSGNGKFVGVGGCGNIANSPNGTDWNWSSLGTDALLMDVAFNGSIFVSVGDNGTIQTSPDGITWSIRNSGTAERLWRAEYLNGTFMAVGDKGVILTSDDGTSWSSKTSNTSHVLYDVAFGNGEYVAVGGNSSGNAMVTSNDGETWTVVNTGYLIPFVAITYGNGTFIALGQNGQVYKPTGGEQWSRTYLPGSGNYPKDIIYADGRFIATGGYGEIYFSDDDGENWTVMEKVDGVNDYINSIAYGGGNLAAVTSYSKILHSSDKGDTWTQQISGFENQMNLYGVAAGNSNFVAVGDRGLTLQSRDFGAPGNPDADAVAADTAALTWDTIKGANSTENSITSGLNLITAGANGTAITWGASPTGWINTSTGAVTTPTSAQGDQSVTLTATISKGSASAAKDFNLTIKAATAQLTPDKAIDLDWDALTWNTIKGANSTENSVTNSLNLITAGANGTTITWSASPTGWINTSTGAVTRPTSAQGNKAVTLTAVISKAGGTPQNKTFTITITALSSSSSRSSSTTPTGILVTSSGKTASVDKVALTFPAGAVESDIRVQVKETALSAGMTLPEGSKLLSRIMDIVKDKSGNFEKSVTITFSFDNSGLDLNEYDIAIYYYDEDTDKWVALDNIRVDLEAGTISGDTVHLTKFAVIATPKTEEKPVTPQPTVNIPTDISGHWAKDSIMKMINAGVISGYPDETFKPDKTVTRAEFTVMLVKALNLDARAGKTFTDTASHWAKDGISTAAAHGIISGYDETTFGPDDLITREQAAVIISRAAKLEAANNELSFADSKAISPWAKSGVAAASRGGFIGGYPDGSFKPQGNTTRAEAAVVISKLI